MELGGHKVELGHFCIRDLDSLGILSARQLRFDLESRSGLGAADKTDDGFIADQRSSSPVLGNKGKHPVFDFVPLAGSGREVRHVKVESGKIRQALKTPLP